MTIGEGQALRFLSQDEMSSLTIAYDFDELANEYFEQSSSSTNFRELKDCAIFKKQVGFQIKV